MIDKLPLSPTELIAIISAGVVAIIGLTQHIWRTTSLKKMQSYFLNQKLHVQNCNKLEEITSITEDDRLLRSYYLKFTIAKFLYYAFPFIALIFVIIDIVCPLCLFDKINNEFVITQFKLAFSIVGIIIEIIIFGGSGLFIEILKKNTYESLQ